MHDRGLGCFDIALFRVVRTDIIHGATRVQAVLDAVKTLYHEGWDAAGRDGWHQRRCGVIKNNRAIRGDSRAHQRRQGCCRSWSFGVTDRAMGRAADAVLGYLPSASHGFHRGREGKKEDGMPVVRAKKK